MNFSKDVIKGWPFFLLLLFISLSFLIFQRGVWLYNDVGWWPKNSVENDYLLKQILNSWDVFSDSNYGYDNSTNGVLKLLPSTLTYILVKFFGSDFSQLIYYILLQSVSFISFRKFNFLFEESSIKWGALFYSFNPISIFLYSQPNGFAAYSFIPLFLFSLIALFRSFKIGYLATLFISFLFITSYLRILGIVVYLMLFIFLINYKQIIKFLQSNRKSLIIKQFSFTILFVSSYLVIYLPSYFFNLSNNHISSDYLKFQIKNFGYLFYLKFYNSNIFDQINLNFVVENYTTQFSKLFVFISILIYILLCFSYLFNYTYNKTLSKILLCLIIVVIFALNSASIFSDNLFLFLFSTLFPFLTSNINWLKVSLIILISIYLLNINYNTNILNKIIAIFIIFSSSIPGISWISGNNKIYKQQIFDEYFTELNNNYEKKSNFIYPNNIYSWIKEESYHYPINRNFNSQFNPLLSSNARKVGETQFMLSSLLSANPEKFQLFSLDSITVLNQVANSKPEYDKFDFYPNRNYKSESVQINKEFESNKKLLLTKSNDTFNEYKFINNETHNFRFYAPKKINYSTIEEFEKLEINAEQEPIIVSDDIYNRPFSVLNEMYAAIDNNQNLKLEIKRFSSNSTKYYIKLSGSKKNLPNLIHIAQSYDPAWSIYTSDEKEFNAIQCSYYQEFIISKNSMCIEENYPSLLTYTNTLGRVKLSSDNHFAGNFVGNSFVIDSSFKSNFNGDSIYLLLNYDKQNYYLTSIYLIITTILSILIYSSWEILKK